MMRCGSGKTRFVSAAIDDRLALIVLEGPVAVANRCCQVGIKRPSG